MSNESALIKLIILIFVFLVGYCTVFLVGKCIGSPKETKPEAEATHTVPTGVEVEWKSGKNITWGIIKDYDRNLQWCFVYIGSTITILPDSQQPIVKETK